jgi:hypothetical protein
MGFGSRVEEAADSKFYNQYEDKFLFLNNSLNYKNWNWQLDLRALNKETSDGNLDVELNRHELNAWGLWDLTPQWKTKWYLGPGLGIIKEKVVMNLGAMDSSETSGDLALQISAQAGVYWNLFNKIKFKLYFENYWPLDNNGRSDMFSIGLMLGFML